MMVKKMNNLSEIDNILELYNLLKYQTNDRRELHYLILYYKYANKEIPYKNFDAILETPKILKMDT
jgi:hypothetical protein